MINKFVHIVLLTLFTCIGVVGGAYAQQTKLAEAEQALKESDFEKAKQAIELALTAEDVSNDPKAWYYNGFINKELYKRKDAATGGMTYRQNALNYINKCIGLDKENKYTNDCKNITKYLLSTIKTDAVNTLNKEDYKNSFNYFKFYLSNYHLISNAIDTASIYYAGYAAHRNGDIPEAIHYLDLAMQYAYNDPLLYVILSDDYLATNNIKQADNVVLLATEKYNDNKEIEQLRVRYYSQTNNITLLILSLHQAIRTEPTNLDYHLLLSQVYEKLAVNDSINKRSHLHNAEKSYLQILTINANNTTANYSLGIIYYNQAVDIINKQNYNIDFTTLAQIQDECVDLFKKALPFALKAYELEPKNKNVLEMLSGIYFGLNDLDKSNQFKTELENLKK
jgi:tetratricopeptide (TPR) repeat protein